MKKKESKKEKSTQQYQFFCAAKLNNIRNKCEISFGDEVIESEME